MKKLYEFLGRDKPLDGDFGIEIEVEGDKLPKVDNDTWKSVKDGSLRGESYEYVLVQPLVREKVRPALDLLNKRFKNSKLEFSFRTSVHVHMNMMTCTHDEILNTIYTYLLLEEPLLSYCGKERKGNRFCLRLQDAEGILDTLSKMFGADIRSLRHIVHDSIRYASINLEALTKYGSLEFRALRGTADIDIIDDWVEVLHRIRTFACTQENPLKIMEAYNSTNPLDFMKQVLGDISYKFVFPRTEDDIRRSFSLSIDLPYCYKNRKDTTVTDTISGEAYFKIDKVGPIGRPMVQDILGNTFHMGDIVRIVAQCPDAGVGWSEDMDEYVDNEEEYEVVDILHLNGSSIVLADIPFYWPPESLRIIRRG